MKNSCPVKKKKFKLSGEPKFAIVLTVPYNVGSRGSYHCFSQGSIVELTYLNEAHSQYADFRNKDGLVQVLHPSDFEFLK